MQRDEVAPSPPPAPAALWRRCAKWSLIAILAALTTGYLTGIAILWLFVRPIGCSYPFWVYAWTWPWWRIMPEWLALAVTSWSISLCP